jgi:hypothetical protein
MSSKAGGGCNAATDIATAFSRSAVDMASVDLDAERDEHLALGAPDRRALRHGLTRHEEPREAAVGQARAAGDGRASSAVDECAGAGRR